MKLIAFSVLSLLSISIFAQNILNASTPDSYREEVANKIKVTNAGDTVSTARVPLEYGYVEDKDVIWSKVVWEVIDFNEKLNQVFYRSSDGIVNQSYSLFDAIVDGVRDGHITQVFDDEFFTTKMTYEQIMARMVRSDSTYYLQQLEEYEEADENLIFNFEVDAQDIKMIKVKGQWYIDRRLGEMRYRLLGLCVLGPDAQVIGTEYNDGVFVELFWIWYPDARNTLINHSVFNPHNSASGITFDDILNARRFSSVIYKAHTTSGSRPIEDYIPEDAKGQLEEHERIKSSILQVESDMWNY